MPSSAIIYAAVFAAGAAIGAGAAATITHKRLKQSQQNLHSNVAIVESQKRYPGIVDIKTPFLGGEVLKYGNPGPIADLLTRKAYVVGYDRRLRHPAWTAEYLTRASLGRSLVEPPSVSESGGDRSKSTFIEDGELPVPFRARLQDYFRSGYDRGHMVPAADAKISQEAMDETFILSNIAPQVGEGFNRHYWAYLERWCRDLTLSFSDVYVFTIPLYLPQLDTDGKWRVRYEVIGNPPNVAVPTHFAKVVLTSRPVSPSTPKVLEVSTGAFVLPNRSIRDDEPLEKFVVTVEAVEKAAGLQLFSDEVKKESRHICQTATCQLVVRRFDDAQKQVGKDKKYKAIAAPASK